MPNPRWYSFKRPQQVAALLLLMLLSQCLWVMHHQTLTGRDYDFARCGREMWEKPSPLAGYFTSCGNIHDGALGYRVAGLPLTIELILDGRSTSASTWEMRHQLSEVLLLLHSGFLLAGLGLGAALWWVTRRLYGNMGGFIALAFYCFSPPVIHACTYPNNEILAAFGFFAAIYTAIGVAHAMHGPPRRWRSRILLLTLAFGCTAAAHAAAFLLAFLLALILMVYLAEDRRGYILPVMMTSLTGAMLLVFACYAFRLDAFSYYFRSGAGRIWFSPAQAGRWFLSLPNAAVAIASVTALLLYGLIPRSRYFGNTVPLLVSLLLLPLVTTGISSEPTLWALPFVLAFIAGVFADVLETRQRRIFLSAAGALLILEAALGLASLPA